MVKKRFFEFIPAEEKGAIIPLKLSEVVFITLKDGVITANLGARYFTVKKFTSLDSLLDRLDPGVFFRANRGAIIHIGKIRLVVQKSTTQNGLVMENGEEILMSVKRKKSLWKVFGWDP